MENVKLELKKIKHSEWNSQETNNYQAELWVNDKKCAVMSNDGRGGCDMVHTYGIPNGNELMKIAEAYCKTLPDVEGLKMDLELWAGEQLENFLIEKDKKKHKKKLEKDMLNSIVVGVPDTFEYGVYRFQRPISSFDLSIPSVKQGLMESISRVKTKLLPNEVILNTNIPSELLK